VRAEPASRARARIILMTGGILMSSVRQLLESVPNSVIAKPFDFAALRDLIRRRSLADAPSPRASRP